MSKQMKMERRYRAKRSGEVDCISDLPDSLLCQVLMNLSTKVVVKTSVLSTRWRDLWKHVPVLEFECENFSEYTTFLRVVDSFLGLNSESSSYLERVKLTYNCDVYNNETHRALIIRWINVAVKRKVKYLHVMDDGCMNDEVKISPTVYTCESLVCLKLDGVMLPNPKIVSLPSLKAIDLSLAKFDNALGLETLISLCPVLESLIIGNYLCDPMDILCVRSQTLLNFTHIAESYDVFYGDLVVVIDAPRLEYLRLLDCRTASFIVRNLTSLVEVDIDTVFNLGLDKKFDPNDLTKRSMIRNFLDGISHIKSMVITTSTLEIIYDYSKCEPLPLFCNLSFLRVDFCDYSWETLPVFLQSCPNLKSLVVGSTRYIEREKIEILFGPWCLLSTLEYVEIERPLKGEVMEMKLVRYLLENSTILKKLRLCLDDSIKKKQSAVLRKELLTIPRLSTSCQVVF